MNKIIFLLFLLVLSVNQSQSSTKNRQKSPLNSLSKKYVLNMSVVESVKGGYDKWWQIEIISPLKKEKYTDNETFPGRFNIYWDWDKDDRIWFYNSDDGSIYYWQNIKGKWLKKKYNRSDKSIKVPCSILPDYSGS